MKVLDTLELGMEVLSLSHYNTEIQHVIVDSLPWAGKSSRREQMLRPDRLVWKY
jgi:hypothetical protein